ncbi:MAG: hypothetical protein RL272_416 [Candidatus Parcubacteria bacterium]|jgi:hypothetical protein
MRETGFTAAESKTLRRLDSPAKIQDFLDAMPMNFCRRGDTCMSPRRVLRERRAHCLEGAMLAAAALRLHGRPPLVMDLEATDDDDDHVVALFRERGRWGAISKTNHAVLRYREPAYRSVRELAMSYFHEYFLDDGRKTLRRYSDPVDLSKFDRRGWMTDEDDVWYVERHLYRVRHAPILTRAGLSALRPADPIEIRAGKIADWRPDGGKCRK